MGERSSFEEKIIKEMDVLGHQDEPDVKAAVMQRVRAIYEQNKSAPAKTHMSGEENSPPEIEAPVMQKQTRMSKPPSRLRTTRRMIGVSAAVLLGVIGVGIFQLSSTGGLTETTITPAINVIKPTDEDSITLVNSGGQTVVQTIQEFKTFPVPTTSPALEKYVQLKSMYEEQVLDYLNPGEMAAFYVSDDEFKKLAKGHGYEQPYYYAFNPPVYSEFEEFEHELREVGDFWPEIPSMLTSGYEFEKGTFKAQIPVSATEMNEDFQPLQPDDPIAQKLFVAKIDVDAIENAEVTYRKGEQKLELNLSENKKMGNGASQLYILPGQTAEIWSMTDSGKEAIFIAASQEQGGHAWNSQNRLIWYDEASRKIRTINDKEDSKLTREQWEEVAASFIR